MMRLDRRDLFASRRGLGRRWVLLLLAPMLALGGCATYLSAQVTTFHQPEQSLGGRRFAIEPTPEQRDSLEFQAYADLVRQALVAHGLIDAGGGPADTTVVMRYGVDEGRSVAYSYPNYGYAPYGPVWGLSPYRGPGGVVRYAWTPTYPMTYDVVGSSVAQSVVYRRELRVELTDRRGGAAADGPGPRLYEGTAVTEGASASLAPVMPAMIRALFESFPGANGSSRVVQVVLDPEPARR